jgi:hypothetical protein
LASPRHYLPLSTLYFSPRTVHAAAATSLARPDPLMTRTWRM